MESGGTSIDSLWEGDFSFHKTRKILDILEKHRIGNLSLEESELLSHQKPREDMPTFTVEEIQKHADE
jgi:hypothetical protein